MIIIDELLLNGWELGWNKQCIQRDMPRGHWVYTLEKEIMDNYKGWHMGTDREKKNSQTSGICIPWKSMRDKTKYTIVWIKILKENKEIQNTICRRTIRKSRKKL